MKLHIKNMVSNRCKMVVREELTKLGLHFLIVELGEVEIMEDISAELRQQLKINLRNSGLELMEDKRAALIEKIKNIIIEMVQNPGEIKIKISDLLSEKLHHNYGYLSNLFSEVQGMSIQHFIMLYKVERIKELMRYDDPSITEIAYKMNYSSVGHLSNQFKKITGLSPEHFKELKDKGRIQSEEIENSYRDRENKSILITGDANLILER